MAFCAFRYIILWLIKINTNDSSYSLNVGIHEPQLKDEEDFEFNSVTKINDKDDIEE